jgi:hypothetical protein
MDLKEIGVEMVWTLWRREKYPAPAENGTAQPVT